MELDASYSNILGIRRFTSVNNLKPGSVVQFTYDNEQKYAIVLNPRFDNKMHALSLGNLSPSTVKHILENVQRLNTTNADVIYQFYKTSEYASSRSYRTYSVGKIKSLREIYLKEEKT